MAAAFRRDRAALQSGGGGVGEEEEEEEEEEIASPSGERVPRTFCPAPLLKEDTEEEHRRPLPSVRLRVSNQTNPERSVGVRLRVSNQD